MKTNQFPLLKVREVSKIKNPANRNNGQSIPCMDTKFSQMLSSAYSQQVVKLLCVTIRRVHSAEGPHIFIIFNIENVTREVIVTDLKTQCTTSELKSFMTFITVQTKTDSMWESFWFHLCHTLSSWQKSSCCTTSCRKQWNTEIERGIIRNLVPLLFVVLKDAHLHVCTRVCVCLLCQEGCPSCEMCWPAGFHLPSHLTIITWKSLSVVLSVNSLISLTHNNILLVKERVKCRVWSGRLWQADELCLQAIFTFVRDSQRILHLLVTWLTNLFVYPQPDYFPDYFSP